MLNETPRNIVGHCGLYCGACGLYQGKLKQAVENLEKAVSTYDFEKIALELTNWEPAFQQYREFAKVLEGFDKIFGIFGNCPGCVAGGGDPTCSIRGCCEQKAYVTCEECIEMDTCEKLRTTHFQNCFIKALKAALKLNP